MTAASTADSSAGRAPAARPNRRDHHPPTPPRPMAIHETRSGQSAQEKARMISAFGVIGSGDHARASRMPAQGGRV